MLSIPFMLCSEHLPAFTRKVRLLALEKTQSFSLLTFQRQLTPQGTWESQASTIFAQSYVTVQSAKAAIDSWSWSLLRTKLTWQALNSFRYVNVPCLQRGMMN